ncbi:MAG TPA: alcohol dehydrogenase catalytic domain-containing protein, partial [Acidimicrobiia bacterium]|nr:alcohol dehydrogenase catalytic domain-containing protein [Acidimicrobiia bacterium]
LLRVLAVGLCGSDAHWFREGAIGDAALGDGLVLGHEFSAVIETGPRAGQRVAVDPAIPCLTCEQCVAGRPNLCLNLEFAGHGIDGGMRRHMIWPERCLVPIPEHIPDVQGAMLEPLGVAIHAIDLAGDIEGASVGVIGCGPIGLLLVAALRRSGASRIVTTDPLAHRLEAALAMGANDLDGEDGLDVVFETAGSDSALHTALTVAGPGARVVLIGIPDGDRTSYVASLARRKELTLVVCHRMLPGDLVRAAEMAGSGLPGLESMVTHRYPISQATEAFHTLISRVGLKVVIIP